MKKTTLIQNASVSTWIQTGNLPVDDSLCCLSLCHHTLSMFISLHCLFLSSLSGCSNFCFHICRVWSSVDWGLWENMTCALLHGPVAPGWGPLFVYECCYCGAVQLFEWDLCIVSPQTWNTTKVRQGWVKVYCVCIETAWIPYPAAGVCSQSIVFDLPQVCVCMCVVIICIWRLML